MRDHNHVWAAANGSTNAKGAAFVFGSAAQTLFSSFANDYWDFAQTTLEYAPK